MDGIGAGDLASRHDLVDVQVAVAGRRRSDADAFIGEPDMHGIRIGGRMHRDRGDAEFLARAQDPESDLAAIGYEDLGYHADSTYSMTRSGSPNSTGAASATMIAVTLPDRGAGIWFMVF